MHLPSAITLDPDLQRVATTLMACPTAPYHEQQTRAAMRSLVEGLSHTTVQEDIYGNTLVHYRRNPEPGHAFSLVAHLDHPGFVVCTVQGKRNAQFLGGMHLRYFEGKEVIFYNTDGPEALGSARIVRAEAAKGHTKVFFDAEPPRHARFGMWDLPPFRITSTRCRGRAFDDLAGCASMIALLRRLARNRAEADVCCLFTRAEEVGFHGALASLKGSLKLPKGPVLSIETSNAQGFAKLGAGPILRVGDRATIFTPAVTAWLELALADLGRLQTRFPYQRLLMGGGTCEGTVFQQAGFPTGAMCLALQNFHNMGPGSNVAAEALSVQDWQMLHEFLFYLATVASPCHTAHSTELCQRLKDLQEDALKKLI
ncbi:MAG: hypothetical protein ACAI35_26750 [Candidatus Methylacidiphilales bacterium]|nr:hypothetical protein [Candidatus Methylacidiphilales bacterium]